MENMDNMKQLDLNEMEKVSGGKNEGGYTVKPREKHGCKIYKIVHGDTLIRIANRNHTTVDEIMDVNPELVNESFIVAGCYIYIPV